MARYYAWLLWVVEVEGGGLWWTMDAVSQRITYTAHDDP